VQELAAAGSQQPDPVLAGRGGDLVVTGGAAAADDVADAGACTSSTCHSSPVTSSKVENTLCYLMEKLSC